MRQTSTGLLCAVKKLGKAALTAGEEAEHLAEVKALQTLQHPCILRYYGSVELDETLSLVMEFADAGDLQQLLKEQADSGKLFEVAALFAVFSQLVVAVAHVHEQRVMHRDLKPSNVMLTSDGLLKLGDFGVAKVLAGTTVMDNMTCVGSPTYMAPEIVSGDAYGPSCDVWSLGVILYEMSSFRRPFEGRSLGELVMRISSGQFQELGEHLRDQPGGAVLDEAVKPFTARMLVADPKQRGTMREVVRLPAMQIFASSLKTSAVVVAALLRDLKEPSKSKGVEIDSAAVDELIAELASSPKRDSSSTLKGLQSGSSSAVPSGPRALAKVKQTVELDDSLAFSMTASERGSKEISFSLTATEELKPSPSVPSEGGRRSGQTVGSTGFGASQDHHALRDVLTDAASARSRSPSTEGGTRRAPRTGGLASQDPHALHVLGDALPPRSPSPHQATEAIGKRRGSPAGTGGLAASQDQHALRDVLGNALGPSASASHHVPVLNQSTSEVSKALAQKSLQRAGAAGLAGTQDHHALRDVLGDALGLTSEPGRSEMGTVEMRHSQSAGTVEAAAEIESKQAGEAGSVLMDQVSCGWKVSSRSSPSTVPPERRKPQASVHVVTNEEPLGRARAPSLRAAGQLGLGKRGASADLAQRPSSQGFDADRSVTWPEVYAARRTESQSSLGSDRTPAAGRPSTPDSAREAKVEKEKVRDQHRSGGLSIPFVDQTPGAPMKQPPKGFTERMAEHERRQREKKSEMAAAEMKAKAATTPDPRGTGRGLLQDSRSRTTAR